MKKRIKEIIVAVLTLLVLSYARSSRGAESQRMQLVADNGIGLLYSVDDFYTFIAGVPDTISIEKNDAVIVNRYFDPSGEGRFKAYLIKHNTPQPLVYKSPVISKDIDSLPTSVKLIGETFDGKKSGLSALDLYEQANIVCRAKKGLPAYVITKRYGDFKRLTKVPAIEAFSYILLAENTGDAWLMACEGKEKFLVEKNYRVMNGGTDAADIYSGTALEGVSYVENSPYAEDLFAERPRKEASPAEKAAFMKDMARSIAALKMGFVRPYKGVRYAGTYNEKDGCGMVSISRAEELSAEPRIIMADFSVCSGKVTGAGERIIKETIYAKKRLSPGNAVMVTRKDESR
jgi:hypothetical protein